MRRFLTVALSAVPLACGEPVQPDPRDLPISLSLEGPEVLELDCDLTNVGEYTAHIPTGLIERTTWTVNGDTTDPSNASGTRLSYRFEDVGSYTVSVSVLGQDGSTAEDEMVTVTEPPHDIEPCFPDARINGAFAHLIRTGLQSVTAQYGAALPRALEPLVENYVWRIDKVDGSLETLLEGADAEQVEVTFDEERVHNLSLDFVIGGVIHGLSKRVGIRKGEPVTERGFLVFVASGRRRIGSSRTIRLMDGETGYVSDPLYVSGLMTGNQIACEPGPDGNRMIFTENVILPSGLQGGGNLHVIDRNGANKKMVFYSEGLAMAVSWSINDVLAFTDDTRSGNIVDELYTMNLDGSNLKALGGPEVNRTYNGWYTSWSPDGTVIALGGAEYHPAPDSVETRGVLVYPDVPGSDGLPMVRLLHNMPFSEAYPPPVPGTLGMVEASSGMVFSPDGAWVAYSIGLGPELTYHYIAKARADGSGDVQLLTLGFGPLVYSPSGDYLFFNRAFFDEENERAGKSIMALPVHGGQEINMTALSIEQGYNLWDYNDNVGCWLHKGR